MIEYSIKMAVMVEKSSELSVNPLQAEWDKQTIGLRVSLEIMRQPSPETLDGINDGVRELVFDAYRGNLDHTKVGSGIDDIRTCLVGLFSDFLPISVPAGIYLKKNGAIIRRIPPYYIDALIKRYGLVTGVSMKVKNLEREMELPKTSGYGILRSALSMVAINPVVQEVMGFVRR